MKSDKAKMRPKGSIVEKSHLSAIDHANAFVSSPASVMPGPSDSPEFHLK